METEFKIGGDTFHACECDGGVVEIQDDEGDFLLKFNTQDKQREIAVNAYFSGMKMGRKLGRSEKAHEIRRALETP